MPSNIQEDAVPFRVALILKRYKFGSNIAARYLGKSRGLVQSWMQAGESHILADSKFKMKAFEKKLRKIRRRVTQENMYYLLAMKLIDLKIPPEYIAKHLGLPISTVRSWKEGVSPKGVKRLFIDRSIVDREFKKLMEVLKYNSTRQNMFYYLSIKLSEIGRQKVGKRRIGGKTIGTILTKHFNLTMPLPKETVTCWIDGRRTPKSAYKLLRDEKLIEQGYKKIVDELTHENMEYHVAKALYDEYDWSYSKISQVLGLDKERVRGWVKKDRGNPVAKCFYNESIIEDELKKYVTLAQDGGEPLTEGEEVQKSYEENQAEIDLELEDEILYHLSLFPSGISSPEAIMSILIDNKDSVIEEIQKVLDNSPGIIRKGKRWFLRD